MKKFLLLVVFYGTLSFQINAQYNTSDVFEVNEITWYGLDFSNVRLIGAIGFQNPEKIQSYYFDVWNSLIFSEADKYNLAKFFHKESVKHYLDIVKEMNTLPNSDELVIEIEYSFGAEKVMQIISEYDSGDKEGIGLVFIIESLNKQKEKAFVWVTFFDIQTKRVLLTENFDGKAGGFGFRNYWAGAYYEIMKSAYKSMRKSWEISNK
jgi:hypothetical protein